MVNQQANGTRQRSPSSSQSPRTVQNNLPPPRRSKVTRHDVSLPLENTRLRNLIFLLVFLTALLTAFYGYRIGQHKKAVGGWWNLALGRKAPVAFENAASGPGYGAGQGNNRARGTSVEEKINDLAEALGMPSNELASAIALAVRNYVPPASLSSVAAKETGTAVKVLVEGAEDGAEGVNIPTGTPTGSPGVVAGIVHGVEEFVGMEEP